MKTDLSQVLIPLPKHTLMRLEGAQGQAIAVFSGGVWLTQEGDREDYVLQAGEVFTIDRGGLAIIDALEDSTLALVDPLPARVAAERH